MKRHSNDLEDFSEKVSLSDKTTQKSSKQVHEGIDTKREVENVMYQRFFMSPTEYPLQNGFIDYGPVMVGIKDELIREFKNIFVDERTYEIDPSVLLHHDVLKNSGHIDRFCDVVLSDGNECTVRADHFIEDSIGDFVVLPKDLISRYTYFLELIEKAKIKILERKSLKKESTTNITTSTLQFSYNEVKEILEDIECEEKQVSELSKEEIDFVVVLHNLHSPIGKPFNSAKDHNLIFKIGGVQYLRPELAQSQFVNFRRLYDMNYEKLPFSSLCIGRSYRNEISARGGMLRTKEFYQAEIEYFSEDGSHKDFGLVESIVVDLLPAGNSTTMRCSIKEVYAKKIVSLQAICFFIGRAQEFLLRIGFPKEAIRFRQHNPSEMAHYASDCWDIEIETLSGWIECAGIADRGSFDLKCHSSAINTSARRKVPLRSVYEVIIDRKYLGTRLRSKAKELEEYVKGLSEEYIENMRIGEELTVNFEGKDYMFKLKERKTDSETFYPVVIEPSFGISRILYSLIEKSFYVRSDRTVLHLKPYMSYVHCMIGYLKYFDSYYPLLHRLKQSLKSCGLRFLINERSCSIGRKYAAADEIGIPFFIVFDFETLQSNSATVRERDSMKQIRLPLQDIPLVIYSLVTERSTWDDYAKYHV